jgi:hypothetical protein
VKGIALIMTTTWGKVLYWVFILGLSFTQSLLLSTLFSLIGVTFLWFVPLIISAALGFFAVTWFRSLRDRGEYILKQKALDKQQAVE